MSILGAMIRLSGANLITMLKLCDARVRFRNRPTSMLRFLHTSLAMSSCFFFSYKDLIPHRNDITNQLANQPFEVHAQHVTLACIVDNRKFGVGRHVTRALKHFHASLIVWMIQKGLQGPCRFCVCLSRSCIVSQSRERLSRLQANINTYHVQQLESSGQQCPREEVVTRM